jgi:hypothetical protein
MTRPDDGEVPPIDGRHAGDLKALGRRDDDRVGEPQWEVGVLCDQLSRATQVLGCEVRDLELADNQRREKRFSASWPTRVASI